MAQVFISYRRSDSASVSGRIRDHLVTRFGNEAVFKDVNSIPPGAHFPEYIRDVLQQCVVELVIIGPHWLKAQADDGRRRLDESQDWVRQEIEIGLDLGLTVIPVLVEGAGLPPKTYLPESLQVLRDINAISVSNDPGFSSDMDRLIRAVEQAGVTPINREEIPRHPRHYRFPLVRDLDRRTFKLGDDDAATFAYLTWPIHDVWDEATQLLAEVGEGASSKRGIVIIGEANSGKTRLALEALKQTLPDLPVLRWSEAYTAAELPELEAIPSSGLVLFLDDLPNYAPLTQRGPVGQAVTLFSNPAATLRALLESLPVRPLVIVATCRQEDEERTQAELGWLFRQVHLIKLPHFNADVEDPEAQSIIADFHDHGATHLADWDGTLGSLVLGL